MPVPKTCSQRLREAAARARPCLESAAVSEIGAFLGQQLNPDGGFRGRTATSDLYYTVFGLECALALEVRLPADQIGKYLDGFGDGAGLDFVHLTCLARGRARFPNRHPDSGPAILRRIEAHRAADGGYHPTAGAQRGLIYESFLALLACEELGADLPDRLSLSRCVLGLKTADGAFANQPGLATGTTPVTAAAAVLLTHLGVTVETTVGQWLLAQHQAQGGFRATPGAPFPDLLSTATALHALAAIGQSIEPIRNSCLDFVEGCWTNAGGFGGHVADETADCEYTFYGLLALGHLLCGPRPPLPSDGRDGVRVSV